MHPQLTLPLDTTPATSFETFHVGEANAVAYRAVTALVNGSLPDRQVCLWGPSGVGKSHLLSAACQAISAQGYRVAYLPGELAAQPDALVGLEQCELVCIDDLGRLGRVAELDLGHCIERCRAAGTRLLLAADRPPEALDLGHEELRTRLDWGPRFQLGPLGEEDLRGALARELERRALEVGEDVLDELLARAGRSVSTLRAFVERLDGISLREKRRPTLALVRRALDGLHAGPFGKGRRPPTASDENAVGIGASLPQSSGERSSASDAAALLVGDGADGV